MFRVLDINMKIKWKIRLLLNKLDISLGGRKNQRYIKAIQKLNNARSKLVSRWEMSIVETLLRK